MRNVFNLVLMLAVLAVTGSGVATGEEAVDGFYSNSVPEQSDVMYGYSLGNQLKKFESRPMQGIEGVWEYHEESMTVAIERFSSPSFSSHIAYRIVMLESEDLELLPGTVIGYVAESADQNKFELWIYSEQDGKQLSSPVSCVATHSDGMLTFQRMKELKVKVRVNLSRFLPSLFKGITISPEIKTEPLPVGFRRVYPAVDDDKVNDEIRYL